jgi:hypothetical protein
MTRKTTSHEISKRHPPALASGIPVFCKYDVIDYPEGLKPHPDNAHRGHPAKQLDAYERVIAGPGLVDGDIRWQTPEQKRKGNGWRKAIVVSLRSGFITKGHGAWLMAKRRGWMVPVEYQQYKSLAEERRDLLADNKLPAMSITDNEKLAKLLSELDATDLELSAFNQAELDKLMRDTAAIEGEFPITAKLGESYDFVVIYTTNATEFVFLQSLLNIRQERSYKKTGVGLGRAISLERALGALRENRHSIDVQGAKHDHAPAHSRRGRLCARKPTRRVR